MSHSSGSKLVKRPARLQASFLRVGPASRVVFQVDVDAVVELLLELAAAAEESVSTVTDFGSGFGACDVAYVCGAERVDDVISGRIDSEPDGAYADYVTLVATELDALSAGIRAVEANAPGGVLVSIPAPVSPEGIVSLTGYLAEQGLGEAPGELYMPEFNYCRIGEGGEIETDPGADGVVLPLFTWTPLVDEFDIVGGSVDVLDAIEAQLNANLPDMRTIPPIETGVTVVQFPMWLWLNEPFTAAVAEAESDAGHVLVRGRATLDHVTWTLGDHELTCTLDEMREFVPDSGMDVADRPACQMPRPARGCTHHGDRREVQWSECAIFSTCVCT